MNDKRVRTSWGLLAILLGLPAAAFADGACTCDDICKIEKKLQEREQLLEVAKQVAAEAKKKTFPTASWSKERFLEIAFPDNNYQVQGVQDYGETPKVSPEQKQNNCDSIWKATEAHEQDHEKFDSTMPNWKYPWIMIFGQEGEFLANKEASGYAAEVNYLRNELEKLKKNCPNANCDGDEPQIERYEERANIARAEQKERVQRAADRVAAYAASVK